MLCGQLNQNDMSVFLKDIFPTMLLSGQADDLSMCEKAESLALAFKETAQNATLVSDHWNLQTPSSEQEEFDKHGVTSFNSGNLLEKEEWAEVSAFIYDFANTMVRSMYDGPNRLSLINMWTTVYPEGAFVPEHIHANSLLSGVFYVKAEENCGNIVFHDPAYIAKTMFVRDKYSFPTVNTNFEHQVRAGNMVIFPSWLPHATLANKSGQNRIILSFNMDLVPPLE